MFSNILLGTLVTNLLFLTCVSLKIFSKTDKGYFRFQAGQFLIKRNCHNFRSSDDIDIKLEPATKLDKRNKKPSKTFDHHIMPENCDAIAIFPIYSQFGGTQKLDSRRIVCKTYILINSNLYLTKTESRTKNSLPHL